MVKKDFAALYEINKLEIEEGYMQGIHIQNDVYNFQVINCYLDSGCDNRKMTQIETLRNMVVDDRHSIICGDFNFVENPMDKIVLREEKEINWGTINNELVAAWKRLQEKIGISEEVQDCITFRHCNRSCEARLDRIYTSIQTADRYVLDTTTTAAAELNQATSDHDPVIFEAQPTYNLEQEEEGERRKFFTPWVINAKRFQQISTEKFITGEKCNAANPWIELEGLNEALKAAERTIKKQQKHIADTPEEKSAIAAAVYRKIHMNTLIIEDIKRYTDAMPQLKSMIEKSWERGKGITINVNLEMLQDLIHQIALEDFSAEVRLIPKIKEGALDRDIVRSSLITKLGKIKPTTGGKVNYLQDHRDKNSYTNC